MKRREFITLIGGAAAAWPLAARAQQPPKMKRIAMVSPSERVANMVASYHRFYRAFFDELSRLGYVEGKTLVVERYSAGGQPDRFAQLARDVVDTRPDVIYAIESTMGLAFKAATTTIPIVTVSPDPVVLGLVSNIARPVRQHHGDRHRRRTGTLGEADRASQGGSPQTVQRLPDHTSSAKKLGRRSLRLGNP